MKGSWPWPDILVTFVIEIFTTEGSTRSVMSAIDSPPARVSAGFDTTVTGAAGPRVSAAISGCICEFTDLVQPPEAAASAATRSRGFVNRRVIIADFLKGWRASCRVPMNRGRRRFIPGQATRENVLAGRFGQADEPK